MKTPGTRPRETGQAGRLYVSQTGFGRYSIFTNS